MTRVMFYDDSMHVILLNSMILYTHYTGSYHFHGTNTYPYINGGMRGVVTVNGDQIKPQPRTTPIREALQTLKGATITGFEVPGGNSYSLEYQINGQNITSIMDSMKMYTLLNS